MAIARLIAPFAGYSGKVGTGDSLGSFGAVVCMPDSNGRTLARTFVTPANPNTTYQQYMRSVFTSISEAMQSLTQPQVDAWKAIAAQITLSGRLGQDYTLGWTALFQRVNSYRVQNGQTIVDDPPTLDTAPGIVVTAVGSDNGDPTQNVDFTYTDAAPSSGGFLAFRLTRDLGSSARSARKNELRYFNTPANCIVARPGSVAPITIVATTLNVRYDEHIGVEVLSISPNYYPSARYFAPNILVVDHT